jgi:hypothetical protein
MYAGVERHGPRVTFVILPLYYVPCVGESLCPHRHFQQALSF